MHVGHLIPFIFTKWLQDVFDCPLVIQISDEEKAAFKGYDFETLHKMGNENAKEIMSCGFNPKKYTEETLKLSYQNSAEIDKVIRDSLKDCTIELCDSKLRGIGLNSCMISTPTSALIYPDGSLGKCEH